MMDALDNHGLSVVQHRKRTVKRLGRIKEDVFNEKEEIEIGIVYLQAPTKYLSAQISALNKLTNNTRKWHEIKGYLYE